MTHTHRWVCADCPDYHVKLCPNCHGAKLVSRPPWIAGDQETWLAGDTGNKYPCPTCGQTGYVNVKTAAS